MHVYLFQRIRFCRDCKFGTLMHEKDPKQSICDKKYLKAMNGTNGLN